MTSRIEILKGKIATLPERPGVYQYLNVDGTIIYIGKAKNLKKRVASYFIKNHTSPKQTILVRNITDIKYIIVATEADALLLENNLIKKYRPRYNVLLKDDKSYPWLCITKEDFPRVFKTRRTNREDEFFGPYSLVRVLNTLLELIGNIYPVRTCKYALTPENIAKKTYKLCLQYHIHRCMGVCQGLQSKEEYNAMIQSIREIAKGNSQIVCDFLKQQMFSLADEYRFEEAQAVKEKYEAIANYQSKSIITTIKDDNLDVFGYDEDETSAYVNLLRIVKGAVVQSYTIEYQKKMDEDRKDLLALAVVELRERLGSTSKDVILPFDTDFELPDVSVTIPLRGDKKKLLDLSQQNARQYRLDKLRWSEQLNPDQRAMRLMKEIQEILHLDKLPQHIECFDNSHISGTSAVASCVVFKKAKPSKSDYRKYSLKTVNGSDDYGSMREVVFRRYKRILEENAPVPDLIITDGGCGQMEVVRQVLEDELHLSIPIMGLAKNDRHATNEILFGAPPIQISLKPTDTLFKFLASIQNEVHRFAITFHRNKRSKGQIVSELDNIKGIGEQTKKALLSRFKSVNRVRMASVDELVEIIGTRRASIIYNYFHP
ncbi:MAG: excinuclease ABC subunit UvrC [Prevotellaceae bacterium]|jgi:excinuclease ABC subunit C|nr:excinuclease ABC subunit UvrC [Prevotellaceae bacterium]